VTGFVVVVSAALVLLLGLVCDGGRALTARMRAINTAQEAARSAAQAVDLAVYRRTGQLTLDPARAAAAARGYLAGTGDTPVSVTVVADRVTVTVGHAEDTQILRLAGLSRIQVTGTATAHAERGLAGGGGR